MLFLLYINDIGNVTDLFYFFLFADDTNAWHISPSLDNLISTTNSELIKLNKWFNINKLILNTKKTKYMIFNPHIRSELNTTVKINNIVIDRVSSITFLGVEMNEHLNWKDHISQIENKITSIIGSSIRSEKR